MVVLKPQGNAHFGELLRKMMTDFMCLPAVYIVFGATGAVGSALVKLLQGQSDATVVASAQEQEVEEVEHKDEAARINMFDSKAVQPLSTQGLQPTIARALAQYHDCRHC